MSKLTREQRTALADAKNDLLEREAERADARRFFWTWVGVSLAVMVLGNAAVVWSGFIPTRIIGTVTVIIPPLLAFMSSIAGMILARVGAESTLASWGTRILWVSAFALTFDGMRTLKLIGLGVSDVAAHTSVWTSWVFPITVDIPLAVGVACIYALRPARNADIRALKRAALETAPVPAKIEPLPVPVSARTVAPTPTPTPTPKTVAKTVAKIEPETENVANRFDGREVVREQLSANSDVLERAQALVDADKTSCSVEETAAVLSALDDGQGASSIARDTGIPRGRVMRIQSAERGLIAV
ncbi:Protein of uncharacterised function (DUF2637) [Mycobacteroides abscessus subsp. abscessus]|uniref:hypothetical protein n=1 Tax=Mycobacteroides abscessus TaxID=36809 RepID=UPI0009A86DCF|nr:hypothetical protein [Mycobacteroides abscessus]SKV12345.1 Protein of uncharacterised function (DUF2637) [Mycobacteroides abscessus subsp. abscessus]